MPTTVTSSIGTSSRDYSTIQAWEDAAPANLVTADQIWRGECYNDATFSEIVTVSGTTTDSTRYKELTTAAGQSFRDNANVQTNALRANQSNGVLLQQSTSYAFTLTVGESNFHLSKMQVVNSINRGAIDAGGNTVTSIDFCILEAGSSTSGGLRLGGASTKVRNTLYVARNSTGGGVRCLYGPQFYNCTFVRTNGLSGASVFSVAYGNIVVKNCACFGFPSGGLTSTTPTTSYTDEASPPAGFTQVTFDTSTGSGFQNITDATRDFRIKSTSAMIDVGTTDSTNAPVDIAGTARPSGAAYDVGAWEYVSAGGATYTLTADSGSFALTGQTAGLAFNRVLAADTQSFALTGQTTGLAFNRTLAADSGSFALTGQDAGLAFNRVLSAASGSFALTGQDATLTYTPISGATYTLAAASGSFALTGQDTGLALNRVLTADTQSYSLSGDVAGLAFNRVLTADTVSYALTGQDVTLAYTSNGFTYTLTAESGSYEVTGQDASLRHTTTAIAGGGGWLPQTRRKSRKQIYEERVKLGILPPPVIKAAAKVAAVAQTVEEFKEERPKYEEMFLKSIKKTEWLPDYTRAIQAAIMELEQEEEEILMLL